MRRNKSLQRTKGKRPVATLRRGLDRHDVAEELDLSPETITGYKALGCPCERRGRKDYFDAAEVHAWMIAHGKTGDAHRPTEAAGSPDLAAAKLRKENALAAKYEHQVQRDRGVFIGIADVKRWIGENVTAAKNKLMGLGAGVTPLLEGRDAAERQSIIDSRVTEILNELADTRAASTAASAALA